MRPKCPWCRADITKERFIANSYYCSCGWSFINVRRVPKEGSLILTGLIVLFVLAGTGLMYKSTNSNLDAEKHFVSEFAARTLASLKTKD